MTLLWVGAGSQVPHSIIGNPTWYLGLVLVSDAHLLRGKRGGKGRAASWVRSHHTLPGHFLVVSEEPRARLVVEKQGRDWGDWLGSPASLYFSL